MNVSNRGKSIVNESPQFLDAQEESLVIRSAFDLPCRPHHRQPLHCRHDSTKRTAQGKTVGGGGGGGGGQGPDWEALDDSEVQRELFRKPRDALLCLAAAFLNAAGPRVKVGLRSYISRPSSLKKTWRNWRRSYQTHPKSLTSSTTRATW